MARKKSNKVVAVVPEVKYTDIKKEREQLAWLNTMNDINGRRVIGQILEQVGLLKCSFVMDPYATAFNEGQRNVGIYITSLINEYCPELYDVMVKENRKEVENDRRNSEYDTSNGITDSY